MNTARKRLVLIAAIGMLAPLWWSWTVSQMTYAVYLASGSPASPTVVLMWTSIYIPSFLLGLVAGLLVAKLSDSKTLNGWFTFFASLVVAAGILGIAFSSPVEHVLSIFNNLGNALFVGGTMVVPGATYVRNRFV